MSSPIQTAIKQICDEKGISEESVIEAIDLALAAAYRKDFAEKTQNIKVEFNPATGELKVFDVKTVMDPPPEEEISDVEENEGKIISTEEVIGEDVIRWNPKLHISMNDAKDMNPDAQYGEEIRVELSVPGEFGRMAAQTAKQVIIQKLREAERNMIYDDFKDREGEVIVGTVQRREGPMIHVDLGKAMAILPPGEQVYGERYTPGARMKMYIISVSMTARGPEIIVSRAHPEIVRQLFSMEIPEISAGTVEIKGIAREAGARSKVAVFTDMDNIDPIGSCVGQRGSRIQAIISELGGEKVDIILYDENPIQYIMNALSPAKVSRVELFDEEKRAVVNVKADQLSLAIGKGGQNIRLAGELTGRKIDIEGEAVEPNPEEKTGSEEKIDATEEKEEAEEKTTE